jgi:hypothetical protein
MDHMLKETTNMTLHANNFSNNGGFMWQHVSNMLHSSSSPMRMKNKHSNSLKTWPRNAIDSFPTTSYSPLQVYCVGRLGIESYLDVEDKVGLSNGGLSELPDMAVGLQGFYWIQLLWKLQGIKKHDCWVAVISLF